jgi:hypothetical protein
MVRHGVGRMPSCALYQAGCARPGGEDEDELLLFVNNSLNEEYLRVLYTSTITGVTVLSTDLTRNMKPGRAEHEWPGGFHMLLTIIISSEKPLASMIELGFPVDTSQGRLWVSLVTSSIWRSLHHWALHLPVSPGHHLGDVVQQPDHPAGEAEGGTPGGGDEGFF